MHADVTSPPVVVGVDGSAGSEAALRWAVEEARYRRAPLRLVHAVEQLQNQPFVRANPVFAAAEQRAAQELLDTAAEHVRARAPELELGCVLDVGAAAVALLAQSQAAAVVVVGSRGRGGFRGLLLGSTSLHVAMRAAAPVVVVRPEPADIEPGPSAGRVVVATDGSRTSVSAVAFAFRRAQERRRGLTAVRVPHPSAVFVDMPSDRRQEQAGCRERAALSQSLATWRRRYPAVDVVEKTVAGNPGAVLVDESAGADLLVVGSRGRGGFSGLLLGSVSHAVLHHAHCPVAVVRR